MFFALFVNTRHSQPSIPLLERVCGRDDKSDDSVVKETVVTFTIH
ncbi:hypothetical protein [Bacteroides gallinarum]|nr:hypothetical protein [Bacteroides gallinarum]